MRSPWNRKRLLGSNSKSGFSLEVQGSERTVFGVWCFMMDKQGGVQDPRSDQINV